MKTILGLIMAAALVSPSVLVSPSQAAMRAMPPVAGEAPATLIAEGCGPGFERGREGRCRPSPRAREDYREEWRERRAREYRWRERERVSVGCPRGYHYRERDGRCWQN